MPILHVVFLSISYPNAVSNWTGVCWWPVSPTTLRGYKIVFQNPNLINGYANTIFYAACTTLLGLFFCSLSGYTLSRQNVYFKPFFMIFLTITMMFNGGLIPTYMLIKNIGLRDTRAAMIIPGCISVFNIIIIRTFIQGIPVSLEESAKLDGAGHMTILFRIVLPLCKAVLAVLTLFYVVGVWNSWFNAAIYLDRRELFPLQLLLREILLQNNSQTITSGIASYEDYDLVKALVQYCTTVVATLPILCIYPFCQKYFVTGVMIGSLKG
jgi:putative aldouronate transport system permease protein